MDELMDTSDDDVTIDEEYDVNQLNDDGRPQWTANNTFHKKVCDTIHTFAIEDKHCDITLEAGVDQKRYVSMENSLVFLNCICL